MRVLRNVFLLLVLSSVGCGGIHPPPQIEKETPMSELVRIKSFKEVLDWFQAHPGQSASLILLVRVPIDLPAEQMTPEVAREYQELANRLDSLMRSPQPDLVEIEQIQLERYKIALRTLGIPEVSRLHREGVQPIREKVMAQLKQMDVFLHRNQLCLYLMEYQ